MPFAKVREAFRTKAEKAAKELARHHGPEDALQLVISEKKYIAPSINILVTIMFATMGMAALFVHFDIDISAAILNEGIFHTDEKEENNSQSNRRIFATFIFVHSFFLFRSSSFAKLAFLETMTHEIVSMNEIKYKTASQALALHPVNFFHAIDQEENQGSEKTVLFIAHHLPKDFLFTLFGIFTSSSVWFHIYDYTKAPPFNSFVSNFIAITCLLLLQLLSTIITYCFITPINPKKRLLKHK